MKRLLTFALAAAFVAGAWASEYVGLRVSFKNDAQPAQTILFEKNPTVTFAAGNLTLTSDGATPLTVSLDNVDKIVPTNNDGTSIVDVDEGQQQTTIVVTSEGITLYGLQPGSAVSIYTLDGRQALALAAASGSCTISRDQLSAGIYLVKTPGNTFKVTL